KFTVTGITAQNTGNGGLFLSGNPGDSITVKATVSNIGPADASNVTASVLAFIATPGGGGPSPVLNCSPANPAGVLIPSNSSQDFLYTCTTSGGNGFVKQFNATANATYLNGPTSVPGSCVDNASNAVSAPTAFGPIMIDKTAPILTDAATSSQAPYIAGTWTNQDVTVTYSCVDNTSAANANSGVAPNSPTGTQTFTQETTAAGV